MVRHIVTHDDPDDTALPTCVAVADRPAGHITHSADTELFNALSAPYIAAGQATQLAAPLTGW